MGARALVNAVVWIALAAAVWEGPVGAFADQKELVERQSRLSGLKDELVLLQADNRELTDSGMAAYIREQLTNLNSNFYWTVVVHTHPSNEADEDGKSGELMLDYTASQYCDKLNPPLDCERTGGALTQETDRTVIAFFVPEAEDLPNPNLVAAFNGIIRLSLTFGKRTDDLKVFLPVVLTSISNKLVNQRFGLPRGIVVWSRDPEKDDTVGLKSTGGHILVDLDVDYDLTRVEEPSRPLVPRKFSVIVLPRVPQ